MIYIAKEDIVSEDQIQVTDVKEYQLFIGANTTDYTAKLKITDRLGHSHIGNITCTRWNYSNPQYGIKIKGIKVSSGILKIVRKKLIEKIG